MMRTAGEVLKGIMTRKGISRRQLAKEMGVSESWIGNLENNHSKPSNKNLKKLFAALKPTKREGQEFISGLLEYDICTEEEEGLQQVIHMVDGLITNYGGTEKLSVVRDNLMQTERAAERRDKILRSMRG